jgi:hypothetical protein
MEGEDNKDNKMSKRAEECNAANSKMDMKSIVRDGRQYVPKERSEKDQGHDCIVGMVVVFQLRYVSILVERRAAVNAHIWQQSLNNGVSTDQIWFQL